MSLEDLENDAEGLRLVGESVHRDIDRLLPGQSKERLRRAFDAVRKDVDQKTAAWSIELLRLRRFLEFIQCHAAAVASAAAFESTIKGQETAGLSLLGFLCPEDWSFYLENAGALQNAQT